ncbi:SGNH/GDSL hydrolase family protein [Actinoplanes rectilineatus]|uniref:SGNH/GDSL hydrolase family protein n=1 Tax=Actinoplanes rectilineatus TaxID=113571 RepID=UPI00069860D1|nr:SGNH/GDSL hydrolase family protein [Actinoplanes rectilineatus]
MLYVGLAALVTAVLLPVVTMAINISQMAWIRHVIPVPQSPPPRGHLIRGNRRNPSRITVAVVGDSFAAGYGASRPRETPAGLIAGRLARRLGCRVDLECLAVMGARTPDLTPQVDRAVALRPHLVLLFVGGNDITNLSPPGRTGRELGEHVRRLRAAGARVVVGGCPDLSVPPLVTRPLTWLMAGLSRRLSQAQAAHVRAAGGVYVDLFTALSPAFSAWPQRMLSPDGFHPSADGYVVAASAVLPAVMDACTGLVSPVELSPVG